MKGTSPTVLLLYSYDCHNHLSCVQSLALLLQNALGCTVMADFWATQEIAERGITPLPPAIVLPLPSKAHVLGMDTFCCYPYQFTIY